MNAIAAPRPWRTPVAPSKLVYFLLTIQVVAGVWYLWNEDWRRGLYWLLASGINLVVTI